MQLTESEARRVWEKMIEAEVRSLYFAELASRYTRHKQWIGGMSLFFSSAAAATFATGIDPRVPTVAATVVAAGTAYSLAVGLDRKVLTMAKLHGQWNRIAHDYEHLWNHWYEDDAEDNFADILRRSRDVSEVGTTEAPYDEKLIEKWQGIVFGLREASDATWISIADFAKLLANQGEAATAVELKV
jgi:hypothetical protein